MSKRDQSWNKNQPEDLIMFFIMHKAYKIRKKKMDSISFMHQLWASYGEFYSH